MTQEFTDGYSFDNPGVNEMFNSYDAYSSILAAWTELGDLEQVIHTNLVVSSTLDNDIEIRFGENDNADYLRIPANTRIVLDRFRHDGKIEARFLSALSSGYLHIISY